MTSDDAPTGTPAPKERIRRFDVFAEYTRQERRDKGVPEDEAKGYGIWLAKVVAARRFSRQPSAPGSTPAAGDRTAEEGEPRFRSVGDELQTDETFDREVVDRMGAGFSAEGFAPAIAEVRARGERYEAIRDAIRGPWKTARR